MVRFVLLVFKPVVLFLCFGLWWEFRSLWSVLCFQFFSNQLCFVCAFFVLFCRKSQSLRSHTPSGFEVCALVCGGSLAVCAPFCASSFQTSCAFFVFFFEVGDAQFVVFFVLPKNSFPDCKKSTNQSTKETQLERAYFQSGRTWPHYFLYFGCRPRSSGQDSPCCQLFWLYSPNRALAYCSLDTTCPLIGLWLQTMAC